MDFHVLNCLGVAGFVDLFDLVGLRLLVVSWWVVCCFLVFWLDLLVWMLF